MDQLIFTPGDVDLARSPLRRSLRADTYALGAFNPALTRLANGNLLLLVRVAEALRDPVAGDHVRSIRWTPDGYVLDAWPVADVDLTDPRIFALRGQAYRFLALTSLSWLLPVELDAGGSRVVAVHYDRAIEPQAEYQHYGVEDPRVARIGDHWWMTTCGVSAGRLCTVMHSSTDGLSWNQHGIVLDHGNKDMIPFEGQQDGRFLALTRPQSDAWFAFPPGEAEAGGPSINLATSPDMLHWKPEASLGIRPLRGDGRAVKLGGGTPPVRDADGNWLLLYHGVERGAVVGSYRTFWALLDGRDPTRLLHRDESDVVLEASDALVAPHRDALYLPAPVVFSTGIVDGGDDWIVASGEADYACRITRLPKARFRRPDR